MYTRSLIAGEYGKSGGRYMKATARNYGSLAYRWAESHVHKIIMQFLYKATAVLTKVKIYAEGLESKRPYTLSESVVSRF